jgi:uncharacterized protein
MDCSNSIRTTWGGTLLIASVLITTGCGASYSRNAQNMAGMYVSGNLDGAIALVGRVENEAPKRDVLVWHLERGALHRAAGDFQASEEAFDRADLTIEEFDWEPEVSISAEAAATLTNLATLPYRGTGYDRIMVSTYRAINMMKLGDMDTARVELNRAFERQREAIERNQRRIDAAEEEAAEARKRGFVVQGNSRPPELDALGDLDIPFADLYQAQGQYVNPFTEFLQGLYLLHAGTSAADLENGRHAFERLAAMTGEHNPYVMEDVTAAENLIRGWSPPPMTYVVFETGRAPSRDQVMIHIPVPVAGVDYVGAAFPMLVFHHNYEPYLLVDSGEGVVETRLVADMDTIIGLEFKNDLPRVAARTIMIAAAQAAAHYGLHQATRGDDLANLLVRFGSVVYRAAQAQADRRTWLTLPKQFQYCRVNTPAERTIVLQTQSTGPVPVKIEPGHINVVYVKSIAAGQPLKVWQFRLR